MEELNLVTINVKCDFCGSSENDYILYGPMYALGKITAHYYCLLLSNRLIQDGNDNEGILGFLLSDILKELKRTTRIRCCYCKKKNATIECSGKSCRRSFHYSCGLKHNSTFKFTDEFKSYCHVHKIFQGIPKKILENASKSKILCCICYEEVNVKNKNRVLWAPCCKKTWYHKYCLQQLAYSAGYFFKCAACNNVRLFKNCMQKHGIFVPQQDASWERVPNAFSELLFKYGSCDAEICKCPLGRQNNAVSTKWEVVVCCTCGSQGIHVSCGRLKDANVDWECTSCEKITKKMQSSMASNSASSSTFSIPKEINNGKKRRGSEDLEKFVLNQRKKSKISSEEDDDEVEIDVVTLDKDSVNVTVNGNKNDVELIEVSSKTDLQEALSLIKPGPLSYKLSVIRQTHDPPMNELQMSSTSFKTQSVVSFIDLTDEEKSGHDDSQVLPSRKKDQGYILLDSESKEFIIKLQDKPQEPDVYVDSEDKITVIDLEYENPSFAKKKNTINPFDTKKPLTKFWESGKEVTILSCENNEPVGTIGLKIVTVYDNDIFTFFD